MKVSDLSSDAVDEVIAEVHAIKRRISEEHGNDINRLLDSLIEQEKEEGVAEETGGRPEANFEKESE